MGNRNDCLARETDEMEDGIGARRRSEQEIPTRNGVLRCALCLRSVEKGKRGNHPGNHDSRKAGGPQVETSGQGAQPMLVRIALGPKDAGYEGNQVRRHEGNASPAQEVVAPCAVTLGKADRRKKRGDHQSGDEDAVEYTRDEVSVRVRFGEINSGRERG